MHDQHVELEANQGDKEAQYLLAKSIKDRAYEGEEANYESNMIIAFEWFQKSAMQNYAPAQCEAGEMLLEGLGVKENEKSGLNWLRKSAEQGHAFAQVKLGAKLLDTGDTEKAHYWFNKAVEQNIPDVQRDCAEKLVDEDPEQAVLWYQLAAESEDAGAQFKLAQLYEDGNGVPKNEEEAFNWYLRAETQSHSDFPDDASFEVGRCYASGQGVEKNSKEALKRLLKIADPRVTKDSWNMPRAQFWVATVFSDPEHTSHDLVEAYAWINLAAAYGTTVQEHYIQFREKLGAQLTKEQKSKAQQRSKELFISRQKIDVRLGRS